MYKKTYIPLRIAHGVRSSFSHHWESKMDLSTLIGNNITVFVGDEKTEMEIRSVRATRTGITIRTAGSKEILTCTTAEWQNRESFGSSIIVEKNDGTDWRIELDAPTTPARIGEDDLMVHADCV